MQASAITYVFKGSKWNPRNGAQKRKNINWDWKSLMEI